MERIDSVIQYMVHGGENGIEKDLVFPPAYPYRRAIYYDLDQH